MGGVEDAVLLLTTNNKWVVVDCKGVVCLQPWISSVKVGATGVVWFCACFVVLQQVFSFCVPHSCITDDVQYCRTVASLRFNIGFFFFFYTTKYSTVQSLFFDRIVSLFGE